MKKIKVILLCLLMTATVLMPYQVAFTAENNINLLFINNVYERADLMSELKYEFGTTPNFIKQINTEVKTKEHKNTFTEYANYDVIAFPLDIIEDNLKTQIQELIKEGKTIYIYGNELHSDTAASIFDIQIDKVKENQLYHIIGIKNDGELKIFLGDYINEGDVDKSFYSDPMRYFSLIVSSIEKNLLQQNDLTISPNNAEAAIRVKSVYDYINNYYYSGILRMTSNLDYFVWREYDSDPNNDYFALETAYELTPHNGTLYRYTIRHEQVTSNHQINNWSPPSSTNSSWTISLPWGISWNFNSILSVRNVTSGSQANDWASWEISRSGLWINSTTRFVPGSAWGVQNPSGYFAIDSKISMETYLDGVGIITYPNFALVCTYFY